MAVGYFNRVALDKEGKPVDKTKGRYEDILWALVNTKEFLFNHFFKTPCGKNLCGIALNLLLKRIEICLEVIKKLP